MPMLARNACWNIASSALAMSCAGCPYTREAEEAEEEEEEEEEEVCVVDVGLVFLFSLSQRVTAALAMGSSGCWECEMTSTSINEGLMLCSEAKWISIFRCAIMRLHMEHGMLFPPQYCWCSCSACSGVSVWQ
jgi:hypothetical protein